MKKLMALSKYLLEFTGLPRENFSAWADIGRPAPTGRHLGFLQGEGGLASREQLQICLWQYDAVIGIERYPGDGSLLVAAVMAWLQDCDPEREYQAVGDPQIDISLNDYSSSDVDIAVAFEEPLVAVEDESGPLVFQGKKWRLAEPEIVPAEYFRLEKRDNAR